MTDTHDGELSLDYTGGFHAGNFALRRDPLRDHMETGHVTPVIDQRFGLRETVDAIRYVEQGHARGKVVVDVA